MIFISLNLWHYTHRLIGCSLSIIIKMAATPPQHINIQYHFIRYIIEAGSTKLVYCPTNYMTADTLTKVLPSVKAKHFATAFGLTTVWGGVLERYRRYANRRSSYLILSFVTFSFILLPSVSLTCVSYLGVTTILLVTRTLFIIRMHGLRLFSAFVP